MKNKCFFRDVVPSDFSPFASVWLLLFPLISQVPSKFKPPHILLRQQLYKRYAAPPMLMYGWRVKGHLPHPSRPLPPHTVFQQPVGFQQPSAPQSPPMKENTHRQAHIRRRQLSIHGLWCLVSVCVGWCKTRHVAVLLHSWSSACTRLHSSPSIKPTSHGPALNINLPSEVLCLQTCVPDLCGGFVVEFPPCWRSWGVYYSCPRVEQWNGRMWYDTLLFHGPSPSNSPPQELLSMYRINSILSSQSKSQSCDWGEFAFNMF